MPRGPDGAARRCPAAERTSEAGKHHEKVEVIYLLAPVRQETLDACGEQRALDIGADRIQYIDRGQTRRSKQRLKSDPK